MVDQAESIKFLNAPVAYALAFIGQDWAAGLVSAGAVAGITSVLLVMLMSQPRIFFSMSRDRLLPPGVSKVHPRFGTPYITTIITCVIVALVAGLTQIQVVGEMTSIGTLFAFVVVCAAVLVLRAKRPDAKRPFQRAVRSGVPGARHPVVLVPDAQPAGAHLGAVPGVARPRHDHLLVLRPHAQPAGQPGGVGARTPMQSLANFITTFGLLLIFNAACIAILGYLTEFGITNETTAKWSEIDVTAEAGRHLRPEVPGRVDRGLGRRLRPDEGVGRKGIAPTTWMAWRVRRAFVRMSRRALPPFSSATAGRPGWASCWPDRTPPRKSTFAIRSRRSATPGCRAELFRLDGVGDARRGAGAGADG